MQHENDDEVVTALREQSRRMVETVFAMLAIVSVALGLATRHYALEIGLVEMDQDAIANCFLTMAVCYVATMFIWDWLYADEE